MNDEITKCVTCGNEMLLRTAEKYGGNCIPCASGYRESLENSRHYYEEQKRRENDPDVLFWKSLCARFSNPALGFNSLPQAEKLFFAVSVLAGEVHNGGFDQYFANSSSDYYDFALRGLEKMGDDLGLDLLRRSARVLFGDEWPSPDRLMRFEQIEALDQTDQEERNAVLNRFNDDFVEHFEKVLQEKIHCYAIENGFW